MSPRPKDPELAKIVEAAQQIDPAGPGGTAAFRSVAMAVAEASMSRRPKPIDTAPRLSGRVLLLYCPEQGGWQTGEWVKHQRCWVSTAEAMERLEPTHWTEVPAAPEDGR